MSTESIPHAAKLYPNLNPAEAGEAEARLNDYVEALLEIYEELCDDPESYARFKTLTENDGTLRL